MRKQLVVDYLVYLAVRLLICGVQSLPLSLLDRASAGLGWVCWHVLHLRRKTIEENLQVAFPGLSDDERERIALGMWRHLFVMVAEIAHAPRKMHRTNWRGRCSISQMKAIISVLVDPRPTVIISGHLGNFELGGYLLALHGFPTHTIARPLDNLFLDRFVNQFRGAKGQYMLPKEGSGPQITELLQHGGTLVLLGDQHAGKAGCWVDFFGKPASTHKAVAVFSLGSMAPTAFCAAIRRGGPLEIHMETADIVDPGASDFQYGTVPQFTQWYTHTLETLIRENPDQYWWVHRRWKGDPADRKRHREACRNQQAA